MHKTNSYLFKLAVKNLIGPLRQVVEVTDKVTIPRSLRSKTQSPSHVREPSQPLASTCNQQAKTHSNTTQGLAPRVKACERKNQNLKHKSPEYSQLIHSTMLPLMDTIAQMISQRKPSRLILPSVIRQSHLMT